MMNKIAITLLVILGLTSCKKEPTVWNTDWSAPLVNDTLSLANLVNDSTLSEVGGYYHVDLERVLFDMNIDSLIKIPDTTIEESFTIAFISFNVPPGYSFVNSTEEHSVNIPDVQLKYVTLKAGAIDVVVENPVATNTIFDVTLPGVTKNGVVFSESYIAPPGTNADPGIFSTTIDLTGYNLDLTGISGGGSNTLRSQISVKTDPNGPTVVMTNQDFSKVKAKFRDVEIYYARGYFGNQLIEDTVTFNIDALDIYESGLVDLPNTSITFEIENGIKVGAEGNMLYAKNTNAVGNTEVLSSPQLLNSYSISPATGAWSSLQPSYKSIEFNSSNSSIESYIENMGASHEVAYKFKLNPWGNVSGGWNELFPNSVFRVKVLADMPLKIGFDQLKLKDTFDLVLNQDPEKTRVLNGELILDVTNGFPMSLDTKLILLDGNDNQLHVISGSSPIESSEFGSVDPTIGINTKDSQVKFLLSEEVVNNINSVKKIVVIAELNTTNPATLMNEQMDIPVGAFLKLLLRSNFTTENVL